MPSITCKLLLPPIAMALALATGPARAAAPSPLPPLLPQPASVSQEDGSFALTNATLQAGDPGARAAANRLNTLLTRAGKPAIPVRKRGSIRLVRDPAVAGGEAYRLAVNSEGVTVSASTDAGLYYGAETLWQLILAGDGKTAPAVRIADAPAFGWRGVMLDSARHFQSVSYIKGLIDRMALVKLNRLHWHLTDDQGWRLPVPAYPRLTSVGAWRQDAGAAGVDPKTGKPRLTGGFYTEAEIRDVVAYAASRHVEIVPEIDMPAHITSAIAAYPWLASRPNPPAAPASDWGILPDVINPNPRGIAFFETVLDQVMRLFPSQLIHIGGDEAVKDHWNANPAVQAQMKTLGLKDAEDLQAWFMAQMADYLKAHGRRAIGWDKSAPLPGDAVVMSWGGSEAAVAAIRAGHDTILSPAPDFYINNRQSQSNDEPPGRRDIISWQRVYEADAPPAALSAEERARVLGLQVDLWTEYVRTPEQTDRMIWPRASVLAEIGWSAAPRQWETFAPRLLAEIKRQQTLGLPVNLAPLQPMGRFTAVDGGKVRAFLDQPARLGTLRYTLDGSAPQPVSPAYSEPLLLDDGAVLTARAFADAQPLGGARNWAISAALTRTLAGGEMEMCSQGRMVRMEDDAPTDGVRRVLTVDLTHPCWLWRGAPLDGVRRISADVGQLPYNSSPKPAPGAVRIEAPNNAIGALRLRLDSCDGPIVGDLSLAPASRSPGVSRIEGALLRPIAGNHDLCITFAQKGIDPIWVLDRMTLEP